TSAYVSVYAIMQRLGWDPSPRGGDVTDRVTSSLGNAIFLGAYLLIALPLTLIRLVDAIIPLWKAPDPEAPPSVSLSRQSLLIALYTALFGIQTVALVWTKSRG